MQMITPLGIDQVHAANGAIIVGITIDRGSGTIGSNTPIPVTFGQVFRPGDVPAGRSISLETASGQVIASQSNIKATYPDGSAKHAIISTLVPVASNSSKHLFLRDIPTSSNTPAFSITDILSSGYNTTVELTMSGTQALYHASVSEAYSLSGVKIQWLQGSIANEWQVRMPFVSSTGVEHPHLMARFGVRAYSGGLIRSDVTIENAWTHEANPQNFTYNVVMKDSLGTPRFSYNNLKHYSHARFREVFWDKGMDPVSTIKHDTNYLIDTKVVPNYDRSIAIDSAAINLEYGNLQ